MNNKRLILFLVLIIVLSGILIFLKFNSNSNSTGENSDAVTIDYDETDTDVDFSSYDITAVNLDDLSDAYTITSAGVYHFTGSLTGSITVNTTGNVKIILDNVTINSANGPAIYVKNGKNTYIELIGNSTITDSTSYNGFDTEVNAAIFSTDDLVLTGSGTLNVTANYEDGIVSKDDLVIASGTYNITSKDDGIRGTDSVTILTGEFTINAGGDGIKATKENDSTKGYILIKDGNFIIKAVNDGMQAASNVEIDAGTFNIVTTGNKSTTSAKGIKAENSILINNINLNATTTDDAIHSNNIITINNGDIVIATGDDGIHADNSLTIAANIDITKSYEGLESNKIIINAGTIKIMATDDGINANGGDTNQVQGSAIDNNDIYLKINGGNIYVNAAGDGLDSNGSIYMNSGTVIVDGPTDNGNGAIDYNNTFVLTGGTLVAFGSSGMAQNVSSTSTQYSVIIYFTSAQSAGTTVSIADIGEFTSSKAFSSLVISSPNFSKNTSYTINVNGSTYKTFTTSSILMTVGSNTSGMGGNSNGMQRR
jgi:hypothetical protein